MYVVRGKRGLFTVDSAQLFIEENVRYHLLKNQDKTLLIRELTQVEIHDDAYMDKRIYLFDLDNQNPEEGNLGLACLALYDFKEKDVTDIEVLEVIRGRKK